jgi:hypothetical protein
MGEWIETVLRRSFSDALERWVEWVWSNYQNQRFEVSLAVEAPLMKSFGALGDLAAARNQGARKQEETKHWK